MKIEKRLINVYITSDGTEFYNLEASIAYENKTIEVNNLRLEFEKLNTKDSSLETLFEVNNTNYIKFLESRIDQLQDQLNSLKVSINSNNLYEKINDRNPDVTGCYITNLGSKFYSKLTERWDTMREGNVDWWFKKLN